MKTMTAVKWIAKIVPPVAFALASSCSGPGLDTSDGSDENGSGGFSGSAAAGGSVGGSGGNTDTGGAGAAGAGAAPTPCEWIEPCARETHCETWDAGSCGASDVTGYMCGKHAGFHFSSWINSSLEGFPYHIECPVDYGGALCSPAAEQCDLHESSAGLCAHLGDVCGDESCLARLHGPESTCEGGALTGHFKCGDRRGWVLGDGRVFSDIRSFQMCCSAPDGLDANMEACPSY